MYSGLFYCEECEFRKRSNFKRSTVSSNNSTRPDIIQSKQNSLKWKTRQSQVNNSKLSENKRTREKNKPQTRWSITSLFFLSDFFMFSAVSRHNALWSVTPSTKKNSHVRFKCSSLSRTLPNTDRIYKIRIICI